MPKLGVDCGNVILCQMNGTPVSGALKLLRIVAQSGVFAPEDIWIVSKCGPIVQQLTLGWLKELDFWNATSIPKENIRFCRDYKGKHPICQELGITHFVDDRPKVLSCLETVKNIYAFNPDPQSLRDYRRTDVSMIIVRSWEELLPHLLKKDNC
jgi:hypothetical protein